MGEPFLPQAIRSRYLNKDPAESFCRVRVLMKAGPCCYVKLHFPLKPFHGTFVHIAYDKNRPLRSFIRSQDKILNPGSNEDT